MSTNTDIVSSQPDTDRDQFEVSEDNPQMLVIRGLIEERAIEEEEIEVSIVMPCLNEDKTVGICIEKALAIFRANDIHGEVIVADNGSTDDSVEIAIAAGARVVYQPLRGYGNAYLMGFEAARGRYIVMADSDNTYDFDDLPSFLNLLRAGYDAVIGNRFRGRIMPGAMPWLHRYIGNPLLSGLLNLFYHTGVGDAHCGMRAFSKDAYRRMHLRTGGMEFASEMVINAAKAGLKIAEMPITYYPRLGESKLQSFRDGWRHLRFMLLYSPTHLYLWPGLAMMLIGFFTLFALTFGPLQIAGATFGFHWMFIGSFISILGVQLIGLGFYARVYSLSSHIDRSRDRVVEFFTKTFRMEHGLFVGILALGFGFVTFLYVLLQWLQGTFDIPQSVRLSILALTLAIIGAQTVFGSFFVSMMVIKRDGWLN